MYIFSGTAWHVDFGYGLIYVFIFVSSSSYSSPLHSALAVVTQSSSNIHNPPLSSHTHITTRVFSLATTDRQITFISYYLTTPFITIDIRPRRALSTHYILLIIYHIKPFDTYHSWYLPQFLVPHTTQNTSIWYILLRTFLILGSTTQDLPLRAFTLSSTTHNHHLMFSQNTHLPLTTERRWAVRS